MGYFLLRMGFFFPCMGQLHFFLPFMGYFLFHMGCFYPLMGQLPYSIGNRDIFNFKQQKTDPIKTRDRSV